MGRGRTGIMKLLLETWRRLLEGDVIQFPQKPKISEANIQFVIMIEDQIAVRLEDLYGDAHSVPIEKIHQLEQLTNSLEDLLKK